MRINLRGAWTGLPILLAMGLSGGGVALWRDLRPPQAAVTRDAALQTQWRRIMALRIPGEENPGARIDTQSFSPIAIPLSGAKLIAWRPQGSGGRDRADPVLVNGTRAFFLAGALRDESAFVFAGP
ncbi:Type IV pilus biogenesis protein PilO [Klebsiella pneumoniae]|nr:Type IV pilus biogenesis protein PilO [Klebsiella pneumoniae]